MKASHIGRLESLEATLSGKPPLHCYLWDDAHKATTVATFRAAHRWPDDGKHPLVVTVFSWMSAQENSDGPIPIQA